MAQLVLGAAGAYIGFLIGGPTGAQIGWAAGSMIGASLGPGTQGPRLADASVQISSYGAALGIVYGGVRKAGNIFWATPLQEYANDGKGGPSVTTFTYTVSCAIAICEGVQGSVRRIWADAKLVYDISEDADPSTQAASAAFGAYFVFYPGDDEQLPDPTIEAIKGAGTVPAYRGTCYVVFTDLPLGEYGNRVPSFSFEVTNQATAEASQEVIKHLYLNPWDTSDKPKHEDGATEYVVLSEDGLTELYRGISFDAAYATISTSWPEYIGYYIGANGVLNVFETDTGINSGGGAQYVNLCFNAEPPGEIINDTIPPDYDACDWFFDTGSSIDVAYLRRNVGHVVGHPGLSRMAGTTGDPTPPGPTYVGDNNCTNYPPDGGVYPVTWYSANRIIRAQRVLTIPTQACDPGDPCLLGVAQLPSDAAFCITCDGAISLNVPLTLESGSFVQLQELIQDESIVLTLPQGPVVRSSDPLAEDEAFWTAAANAIGLSGTYGVDFPVAVSQAAVGDASVMTSPAGSAILSDIVQDICARAGLQSEQMEVSALDDVVAGYQIARQLQSRASIEPLRQTYWFDAVESGDVIRFVKRGAAPVVSIPYEDLGAGEDEPGELTEPERAQEAELPAAINVAYPALVADYQTGTQSARRMTTGSQQIVGVELPVVLDDQRAAEVADVLLYDAWTARTQRKISLPRNYARIEPTDVIEFDDHEFLYRGKVVDKEEDGMVVRLLLRDEDPAAYAPYVVPSITAGGGGELTLDGPTKLELLDIPLLRDVDDGPGYYDAAAGYLPNWAGATIFRSADGGLTFSVVQAVTRVGSMGYADTALASYGGGNTVDEVNSVTVRMHSGTLSSVTRAQLLSDYNAAVLGNEIIQFQRAVLLTGTTYLLTGLLRGRRGTEQHMGTHAVNDRFVLLDPARVYRIADTLANVGEPAVFRAVTAGQALDSAADIDFTDTGASLKPLSVAHLAAVQTSPGVYRAQWVRRTRLDPTWRDGVDAPLGEADEAYEVEVLDGSDVLFSVTTNAQSAVLADDSGTFDLESSPGVAAIHQIGSVLFSLGEASASIRRFELSGALIGGGAYLGENAFYSTATTTDYYASVGNGGGPSQLARVSAATPGTIAATLGGSSANDQRGLCHDGTDLWLATYYSGNLQRLNPTTLAVVNTYGMTGGPHAIYSAGGSLWVCMANSDEVAEVDPGDGSEIQRFSVVNFPTDIVVIGPIAFVGGASQAATYNTATGALISAIDSHGSPGSHSILAWNGSVAASDANAGLITLFNESTGLVSGTLEVPNLQFLAGVAGTVLFVTIGTSIPPQTTRGYGGASSGDLSGKTVRVYQISESVGRGFPAEVVIA